MSLRQQIIQAFTERFGEPELGPDPHGTLYRWRLQREKQLDLHVIIDSPEMESQAHVLLSDPCPGMPPVNSLYVKHAGEIKSVLDKIEAQWQMRDCWA